MKEVALFILSVTIALVLFYGAFFVWGAISVFKDWRRNTQSIDRVIPFSLFLEAYNKAPDRWTLLLYYVRYGKDDVRFENYADYRKYQKWREKRKRDEETERKREANEALYREIRKDLVPTIPTTGNCAITPKPNITIPESRFKGLCKTEIIQELERLIKENAKQDDGVIYVDGAKLVPQPAKTCGDCPWTVGNDPDFVTCINDKKDHLRSELCKYRKQAVLNPTKAVRDGECKKCRYFQKHDKPPYGYCVRNDEITDEAYVKPCFEPIPPIAHKRPELLGTVTTH